MYCKHNDVILSYIRIVKHNALDCVIFHSHRFGVSEYRNKAPAIMRCVSFGRAGRVKRLRHTLVSVKRPFVERTDWFRPFDFRSFSDIRGDNEWEG